MRRMGIVNRPSLGDCYQVFSPIDEVFACLEQGEVNSINGVPVFKDRNGDWCEITPAVEGWISLWERLCRGEGYEFDAKALTKLVAKLRYDSPMTEQEVAEAKAVIEVTRSLYMKLPIEVTKHYAQIEEIEIKAKSLAMREAA